MAEGRADAAAIGEVSLANLKGRGADLTGRVCTIALTTDALGLPLVVSASATDTEVATLLEVLREATNGPALVETLRILVIDGFDRIPLSHYDELLRLEASAAPAGYPFLA